MYFLTFQFRVSRRHYFPPPPPPAGGGLACRKQKLMELVLTECQWRPTPRWVALPLIAKAQFQMETHYPSYWEWQDWFQAQCFSKSCNALYYSWKTLPLALRHSTWGSVQFWKARVSYHSIPYQSELSKGKKKSQVQTHGVFFLLSPILLLCSLYSLRSLDSLITAVVIITHLCFCRALLRSWESFINMTSLIVPAALQVKGSYCPQRLAFQGYLGWDCRCSGARHLGCLEPLVGQPSPEALKAKGALVPCSKVSNFVGLPNQSPQPPGHTHRADVLPSSSNSFPPWPQPKCTIWTICFQVTWTAWPFLGRYLVLQVIFCIIYFLKAQSSLLLTKSLLRERNLFLILLGHSVTSTGFGIQLGVKKCWMMGRWGPEWLSSREHQWGRQMPLLPPPLPSHSLGWPWARSASATLQVPDFHISRPYTAWPLPVLLGFPVILNRALLTSAPMLLF